MNDVLNKYGVTVRHHEMMKDFGKWFVTLRYEVFSGYFSIDPGIIIFVNGKEALRISMNDETGVKEESLDITEFFVPSEDNDVKIQATAVNFRYNDQNYNYSEASAKLRFSQQYFFSETFRTDKVVERFIREFTVKDPR